MRFMRFFFATFSEKTMNISQIIDKYTCIDILGNRVVRKVANGYLAHAPWREDNHPSLTVTLNGRGWHDLTTGEHGNVIDLVAQWKGMTKSEVCSWFDTFMPCSSSSFHPHYKCEGKEKEFGFAKFDVVKLQSKGLFAYLYHRKVNIEIAKQFLMEAHYSFKDGDSYLYALAYQNVKGGYELRSSFFKGCTSPKGITTHFTIENAPVVVFEGVMDMLSFATLCGGVRHNYLVLNSIVNAPAAIEVLQSYTGKIYLSLDNDKGGEDATAWLLQHLPTAKDIRSRFAPYKDVNEYLIQK